jgi:hypothetical protein
MAGCVCYISGSCWLFAVAQKLPSNLYFKLGRKMIIQYEKTFQGAHKFYALAGSGVLLTRQYFFTTKSQALKDFKQLLRGEK